MDICTSVLAPSHVIHAHVWTSNNNLTIIVTPSLRGNVFSTICQLNVLSVWILSVDWSNTWRIQKVHHMNSDRARDNKLWDLAHEVISRLNVNLLGACINQNWTVTTIIFFLIIFFDYFLFWFFCFDFLLIFQVVWSSLLV